MLPLATLLLLSACDTDAVLLPEDFNEQKVKIIEVDSRVELGGVRQLPGLQGGPVATILGDNPLIEQFLKAGVDVVRLPQGYLCDYTLSGIFPNPNGDPTNAEDYDFAKIDTVMAGAAAVGGDIIFQAMYDVGLDTCAVGALDGVQTGAPPKDMNKWKTVVVNTLRHFNDDLVAAEQKMPNGKEFGVRYVEFWDAPMVRGGYNDAASLAADFIQMAESVKLAFPDLAEGQPRMTVMGPAMIIGDAASVAAGTHPIVGFVDALRDQGKIGLLDVLTFQTAVRHPSENAAIAAALRKVLDERTLVDVPMWATRYEPDPSVNIAPKNELEVPFWSIYAGAFASATRVAWQDTVDRAIFYRGDRRHRSLDGSDITSAEQSPLWDGKGEFRPAGIAWQPWRLLASRYHDRAADGKKRVFVKAPPATDADGLFVMAVKDSDAECANSPGQKCPKLFLLIANTNTHLGQTQVDYQIHIDGLGEKGEGERQAVLNWSLIDIGTREFTFTETINLTLIDGDLFYQLSTTIPAVDFIQIDLGPQQ